MYLVLPDDVCRVNIHFSYEFMNSGSCSKCDTVHISYHNIVPIVYSYTNSAAKTKIKYDAGFFFCVCVSWNPKETAS